MGGWGRGRVVEGVGLGLGMVVGVVGVVGVGRWEGVGEGFGEGWVVARGNC